MMILMAQDWVVIVEGVVCLLIEVDKDKHLAGMSHARELLG